MCDEVFRSGNRALLVQSASHLIRVSCTLPADVRWGSVARFLVAKDDFLLGVTSVSSTPGPRECLVICEKTSFCSKFLRYSWLFFFPARWIIKCLHSLFRLTEFKSVTDHKPFKYVKFTFSARKNTYGKETNYIHNYTAITTC